eukprot:4943194-Prymnesium_polylepis.1
MPCVPIRASRPARAVRAEAHTDPLDGSCARGRHDDLWRPGPLSSALLWDVVIRDSHTIAASQSGPRSASVR